MRHIFLVSIAYGLLSIFSLNVWSSNVEEENEIIDEMCPVCWEAYNDDDKQPYLHWECGHPVCPECLRKLIKSNAPCPLCRKESKDQTYDETPSLPSGCSKNRDTLLVKVDELNNIMATAFNATSQLVYSQVPFKAERSITFVQGNSSVTLIHTKHDKVEFFPFSITQTFRPTMVPQDSSVTIKCSTDSRIEITIDDKCTIVDLELLRTAKYNCKSI